MHDGLARAANGDNYQESEMRLGLRRGDANVLFISLGCIWGLKGPKLGLFGKAEVHLREPGALSCRR
jgi:hypothetical protein